MAESPRRGRESIPLSPTRFRPLEALDRLASLPWLSYFMLLLLQLKVMWGVWQYRDLTGADESAFYTRAFLWFKDLSVDLVWSPLYTSFFGTLMHFSTHAYFVTIFHRIIIVLAIDIMILALMRRLLPHWIAWLVAAWWAILPINFDTAFTVHLFPVIPVLAAWLLILYKSNSWTRGGAIGVLLATTLLVRNEYVVATITLAIVCLWWEIRMAGTLEGEPRRRRWSYLMSYGLPILICGALLLFFYSHSVYQFPELWVGSKYQHYSIPPEADRLSWTSRSGLKPKHTHNMCQAYAFGYQQRHPEWNKDPWIDCPELMAATFGKPLPSLAEMLWSNPVAALHHFWWNAGLTPSGVQLLLFNASAGAVNPDYAPARLRSLRALILSLVTGSILALGSCLLYRERRFWWEHWLKDRALGWFAMLSVVAVAGLIIPTQRPRPSYLFCQGIVLMALTGMCLFAISRHWPVLQNPSKWLLIMMAALLLLTPNFYQSYSGPRTLLTLYERLAPFEAIFNRPDTVFLVSSHPVEIHEYVGHNYFTSPFVNRDYAILDKARPDEPLPGFLDQQRINLFYIDEDLWRRLSANPVHRPFLTSPESAGWNILAYQTTANGKWILLEKSSARSASS